MSLPFTKLRRNFARPANRGLLLLIAAVAYYVLYKSGRFHSFHAAFSYSANQPSSDPTSPVQVVSRAEQQKDIQSEIAKKFTTPSLEKYRPKPNPHKSKESTALERQQQRLKNYQKQHALSSDEDEAPRQHIELPLPNFKAAASEETTNDDSQFDLIDTNTARTFKSDNGVIDGITSIDNTRMNTTLEDGDLDENDITDKFDKAEENLLPGQLFIAAGNQLGDDSNIAELDTNLEGESISFIDGEVVQQDEPDNDQFLQRFSDFSSLETADIPETLSGTRPKMTAKFILFRTIGNDLPPRHKVGQSFANLQFILKNEPSLADCEKRWLINRIVNGTEELRIINLLKAHNQTYFRLPFIAEDFAALSTRFEHYPNADMLRSTMYRLYTMRARALLQDDMEHDKIRYIMNINGARNYMLDLAKESGTEWSLPFDGNTFFTKMGWEAVRREVLSHGHMKYFSVPMARVTDNANLLNPHFWPEANEEPQIIFHRSAIERFNENMRYGRRPKVELLMRLGIHGPWDAWPLQYKWEKHITWTSNISADVGAQPVLAAGWIARLYSGQHENDLVASEAERGLHRSRGIQILLARAAAKTAHKLYNFSADTLLAFNETVLSQERAAYNVNSNKALVSTITVLKRFADYALTQGPWSVVDKTELPPSQDKHDYYTPKPYFWPNPHTISGLPYIRMDGQRVPGTELYDEQSDRFDRTRLASLYGNTTCLALAYYFTGEYQYAEKAAQNVRAWFLDPATAMAPSSRYAQIHWGLNNNMGESTGVIEFKDFYFFLDAVRILVRSSVLSAEDLEGLKGWFRKYRSWLERSEQGQNEYMSKNNHGLYFEVQLSAINAFLGDIPRFMYQVNVARGRILEQFSDDGSLPHEMVRKTQLHYMMFTLQGWFTLARIGGMAGVDYWTFQKETDRNPPLKRCAIFTVPYFNKQWRHYQEGRVDMDRMLPLYYTATLHYPDLLDREYAPHVGVPQSLYTVKPLFYEHDGIQPFWNLGLTDAYLRDEEHQ